MGEPVALLVGVGLLGVGAIGATVTQRWLESQGRASIAPLFLIPFGVLIGSGAAIARGWDLVTSMVVGAILVPVVGAAGRLLEVRRAKRRRGQR